MGQASSLSDPILVSAMLANPFGFNGYNGLYNVLSIGPFWNGRSRKVG